MRDAFKLTILVLCLVTLAGCDMCANEVTGTVTSPSARLKAVVFSRDCGATTGFSTQVSIIPVADALPNDGGNALVLDGTVPLQVQWQSDSTLLLTGLGSSQAFKQVTSVAGVSIQYGN